jgi:RNAse (barnase) inhibitor barstar
MEMIDIDGQEWTLADDFYISYFAAVGAPEWHGRNLDALWDSLTAGGVNHRNPPFRIRVSGTTRMSTDVRQILGSFEKLVHEASLEGHPVQIELLP